MPNKYIKKELYVKNCLVCKKEFKQRTTSHVYCSVKCSDKRNNKELKVLNCLICKKEFKQKYPTRIYCSNNCKSLASYYRDAKAIAKKNYKYRKNKMSEDPVFREQMKRYMYEAKKKYLKTEKGKEKFRKWLKTPLAKEIHRRAYKKWSKTEKGREVLRKLSLKHAHTPEGRMHRLKYRLSERGKATRKKYFKYWQNIPKNKMIGMQRKRIGDYLRKKNIPKNHRTREIVGCSPSYLKKYIEKQFKPGMNWNNHANKGWHVDHIKALSKFNWDNPNTLFKAFHYTNLQPLWATENLRKHNK